MMCGLPKNTYDVLKKFSLCCRPPFYILTLSVLSGIGFLVAVLSFFGHGFSVTVPVGFGSLSLSLAVGLFLVVASGLEFLLVSVACGCGCSFSWFWLFRWVLIFSDGFCFVSSFFNG